MRRLTGIVLAVLVAAGCSSGGGKAHVASTSGHPDPAAIASKFGCSGYASESGQVELFAATQGSCTYNGDSVSILTFASTGSFDKWKQAAQQVAGSTGTTVIGDRYAIEASNADEATAIAEAVGGQTQ